MPTETTAQQIARVASLEPCIMTGCRLQYGHKGEHDYTPPAVVPYATVAASVERTPVPAGCSVEHIAGGWRWGVEESGGRDGKTVRVWEWSKPFPTREETEQAAQACFPTPAGWDAAEPGPEQAQKRRSVPTGLCSSCGRRYPHPHVSALCGECEEKEQLPCTCGGVRTGEPCDQTCATRVDVVEARKAEGIAIVPVCTCGKVLTVKDFYAGACYECGMPTAREDIPENLDAREWDVSDMGKISAQHEHHAEPLVGCYKCILPVPALLAWLDSWTPRTESERAARRVRLKRTLRARFGIRDTADHDEPTLRALLVADGDAR